MSLEALSKLDVLMGGAASPGSGTDDPETHVALVFNAFNDFGANITKGALVGAVGSGLTESDGKKYVEIAEERGSLAALEVPIGIAVKAIDDAAYVENSVLINGVFEITQSGLTLNVFDGVFIEKTGSGSAEKWQFTATDSASTYRVGKVVEVVDQSNGNYDIYFDFSLIYSSSGSGGDNNYVTTASFSANVLTLERQGLTNVQATLSAATTSAAGGMSSAQATKLNYLNENHDATRYTVENQETGQIDAGAILVDVGNTFETESIEPYESAIEVQEQRGTLGFLPIPVGIAITDLASATTVQDGMVSMGSVRITDTGNDYTVGQILYLERTGSGAAQQWSITGTKTDYPFAMVSKIVDAATDVYDCWVDFSWLFLGASLASEGNLLNTTEISATGNITSLNLKYIVTGTTANITLTMQETSQAFILPQNKTGRFVVDNSNGQHWVTIQRENSGDVIIGPDNRSIILPPRHPPMEIWARRKGDDSLEFRTGSPLSYKFRIKSGTTLTANGNELASWSFNNFTPPITLISFTGVSSQRITFNVPVRRLRMRTGMSKRWTGTTTSNAFDEPRLKRLVDDANPTRDWYHSVLRIAGGFEQWVTYDWDYISSIAAGSYLTFEAENFGTDSEIENVEMELELEIA